MSSDTQRLDHALQRLQDFVTARLEQELAGDAVSFSLEVEATAWSGSEAELLASLEGHDAMHSFGLVDDATERVRELLERTVRTLTRFAQVSSQSTDGARGVTRVGWSGNVETAFHGTPDNHAAALREGLRTRHQHLRLGVMTVAFAVKIGRQLSVPGGVVAALPAVWTFIRRVMAELDVPRTEEVPTVRSLQPRPSPATLGSVSSRPPLRSLHRPETTRIAGVAPLSPRPPLRHERIFDPGSAP